MKNITLGIIFGGNSTEHNESIRAARILYKHAIPQLKRKYDIQYFYLTKKNHWATERDSLRIIKELERQDKSDIKRILDVKQVDILYSTCMGGCGENGNLAGLADLLRIPIIGCDILPSALCLDKPLTKLVANKIGIPTVKSLTVDKEDNIKRILKLIDKKIGYPIFVKPTNLGTCSHVFKATSKDEFIKKWNKTIKHNDSSQKYLIEQFVPNIEIRVFIHKDRKGKLHLNDDYVTTLKEKSLIKGGTLFDHHDNELGGHDRKKIAKYATQLYDVLKIKDYARIDFFIEQKTGKIYFNEANTQPFISTFNIKLMKKDGFEFHQFIDMLIRKNIK